MKYLAYFVIGLLHFIHIIAIMGNMVGIMASPETGRSLFFLILGIAWAIMYSHIDDAPPIKWANKIIAKENTK